MTTILTIYMCGAPRWQGWGPRFIAASRIILYFCMYLLIAIGSGNCGYRRNWMLAENVEYFQYLRSPAACMTTKKVALAGLGFRFRVQGNNQDPYNNCTHSSFSHPASLSFHKLYTSILRVNCENEFWAAGNRTRVSWLHAKCATTTLPLCSFSQFTIYCFLKALN